jgi:hypothetical protein
VTSNCGERGKADTREEVSDDHPSTSAFSQTEPTGRASLIYLTAGGDTPPPLTAANAHVLDQAAEYLAGIKALRSSAMFDIVWGGLVLGIGLLMLGPLASRGSMYAPIRSVPLAAALVFAALGTVLVGAGVWTYLKPNVTAMVIDGLTLLVLFLLNVAFIGFDLLMGSRPEVIPSIMPLVLLGAAIYRFHSIRRFRQVSQTPLMPATVKWLRELQRDLSRAHIRDDAHLVTFAANSFPIVMFKGRLLDDVAVCLLNNNRLRFLTREQLRATVVSENPKRTNVRITVDDRTLTARLTPVERERFFAWQTPPG